MMAAAVAILSETCVQRMDVDVKIAKVYFRTFPTDEKVAYAYERDCLNHQSESHVLLISCLSASSQRVHELWVKQCFTDTLT